MSVVCVRFLIPAYFFKIASSKDIIVAGHDMPKAKVPESIKKPNIPVVENKVHPIICTAVQRRSSCVSVIAQTTLSSSGVKIS